MTRLKHSRRIRREFSWYGTCSWRGGDAMLPRVNDFTRDVAYGWRSLLRARGFFVVVVLTLALGIGANVGMFSVVYSVLWRPLPYRNADRLVVLSTNIRRVAGLGLS